MTDRIDKLEMLVAEQERAIEELSTVIAGQWTQIEMLRNKLDALSKRFTALEEQTAPETPVTQPPHY